MKAGDGDARPLEARARPAGWSRRRIAVPRAVMFTPIEGQKGYHHCDAIDDTLRFVERPRNHEGVTEA